MTLSTPRSGFTLIQMSIVIVIIGLIVGAIVLGQNLIRASQLQSVPADVATYASAIRQFHDKYNYFPGDMPNATTYWGSNTGSPCGSLSATITSLTSTCNGNGDGIIAGGNWAVGTVTGGDADEVFFAWRHLSNAGMIAGFFTGKDNGSDGYGKIGVNVPASRVPGAGFNITNTVSLGLTGSTWSYPWPKVENLIMLGSNYNGDYTELGQIITPSEALALDLKMDDGKPGTGTIQSLTPSSTTYGAQQCSTSSTASTAAYNIAYKNNACSLLFSIE